MIHSVLPGVAGVDAEESDADKEDEGLEFSVSESLSFLRPCLITTKVSKPRAALITSWKSRSKKVGVISGCSIVMFLTSLFEMTEKHF